MTRDDLRSPKIPQNYPSDIWFPFFKIESATLAKEATHDAPK